MRSLSSVLLVVVVSSLASLPSLQARAQLVQPPPALKLTLEDALSRAELYVPVLVRARGEELQVAARRAGAAMLLPQNPYATFLGGYRRETTSTPTATGFQYQFHIEQPLEIAGQRRTRLDSVFAQLTVAQANREYARTLTRVLVYTAYMHALLAGQQLQVSLNREGIAQRLLEFARVRQRVGAGNEIEVNLAQVEAGRVAGERIEAQAKQEELLGELRLLCGLPPGSELQLAADVQPPGLPGEYQALEVLLNVASTRRADYQALRMQRQVFSRERTRLKREVVPNPVVSLDIQRDLPGQEFYGGSLGLNLPVWNRNQGPLSQTHAAEQVRQREEELLLLRIRSEVTVAFKKLLLLGGAVQDFQRTVLPPAERNLELLRGGWQAGKFDLFRVINASRELAENRLRYIDMLTDLWSAVIELERAVGMPILTKGN